MDYQSRIAYDAGRTFAVDAPIDERLVFLRKTYMLVLLGLGLAAAGGYAGATFLLPYITGSWVTAIALLVVWLAGYYVARAVRAQPGINYLAMFGFAFISGVTLGPMLMLATLIAGGKPTIIVQAVVVTGSMITALSGYVLLTRKDFSFMAGALSVGCVGLIVLLVVGFFTSSTGLHLAISGGGALLFAGFILYDTSKIVRTHPVGDSVGAALDLFLDFFLLFLYVLRFMMLLAGGRD